MIDISIEQQKKPEPITEPQTPAGVEPMTEEQRKQSAKQMYDAMGWGSPPVDPAATAAATEDAPAAPAAAAAAVPPQTDIIQQTATATAKATATEVARAIRSSTVAPAAPEAPAEEPFKMDPQDERDYKVLLYLQDTNPRFAGKADEFLAYVKARYARQDKWISDNPGKEFNPEDPEHVEWEEKNAPDINPDDLESGRIDMKVEERWEKTVQPRIAKMDAEKAFKENLPTIAGNVTKNVLALIQAVNPDIAKLFLDANGHPVMSQAAVAKLNEEDPVIHDVLDELVRDNVEPMLLELEKTVVEGMNYRLNPSRNPVHREIYGYQKEAEAKISSAAEAQIRDGRQWLTVDDFTRRQNKILNGKGSKDQKDKALTELDSSFWCITVDDVAKEIIADYAEEAKKRIEREDVRQKKYEEARARKNGKNTDEIPATPPRRAAAPAVEHAEQPPVTAPVAHYPAGVKPRAPSISSASDVVTAPPAGRPAEKTFGEKAADVHFS